MVRDYKRKTVDLWTKEDLAHGLRLMACSNLKVIEISNLLGISRATLYRQYKKLMEEGGDAENIDMSKFRNRDTSILTKVEEDALVSTLEDMKAEGFSISSTDVRRICFEYCFTNEIPMTFSIVTRTASIDWYYGFLRRNPLIRQICRGTKAPKRIGHSGHKKVRSTTTRPVLKTYTRGNTSNHSEPGQVKVEEKENAHLKMKVD